MPDAVGVPLMVIVLPAHVAETPAGNPFAPGTPAFKIPLAPVVAWVMLGVIAVLLQSDAVLPAVTVLLAVTVIVPVASTLPQPPVNGML